MINCEGCRFYNAEFDDEQRQTDDVIVIDNPDRHFCIMFSEEGIEKSIWECKKDCPERLIIPKHP